MFKAMQTHTHFCMKSHGVKGEVESKDEAERREAVRTCRQDLKTAVSAERQEDDAEHPMSVWIGKHLTASNDGFKECQEKYNAQTEATAEEE